MQIPLRRLFDIVWCGLPRTLLFAQPFFGMSACYVKHIEERKLSAMRCRKSGNLGGKWVDKLEKTDGWRALAPLKLTRSFLSSVPIRSLI